jgi:ABC-2 type transport system permease protein
VSAPGMAAPAGLRPRGSMYLTAFGALILRDLAVLRKDWGTFLIRVLMQPLLLIFVFGYVLPKIGGGVEAGFANVLIPGVLAMAVIFQGIQAVALPLVQEFGYTKEIEDRVMAPLPTWAVACEKVAVGAIQGVVAALLVFPMAYLLPIGEISVSWSHPGELVAILILGPVMAGFLGLAIGTRFPPQKVPLIFSVIILPLVFLGAVYYPWQDLSSIRWLQVLSLADPLVYLSEGFRAALTPQYPHMPLWAIYGALVLAISGLAWLGIRGFYRRVID